VSFEGRIAFVTQTGSSDGTNRSKIGVLKPLTSNSIVTYGCATGQLT
jgi:hypothetical protein